MTAPISVWKEVSVLLWVSAAIIFIAHSEMKPWKHTEMHTENYMNVKEMTLQK